MDERTFGVSDNAYPGGPLPITTHRPAPRGEVVAHVDQFVRERVDKKRTAARAVRPCERLTRSATYTRGEAEPFREGFSGY